MHAVDTNVLVRLLVGTFDRDLSKLEGAARIKS